MATWSMDMVRGKEAQITRKVVPQPDPWFLPTSNTFMNTSTDFVEDRDARAWIETLLLIDDTYTLKTCDCRLPTIGCRGNNAAEHKQAKSAMTPIYCEKLVNWMSPQNELILNDLYQQEADREAEQQAARDAQEQAAREVEQAQSAREAEAQAAREVEQPQGGQQDQPPGGAEWGQAPPREQVLQVKGVVDKDNLSPRESLIRWPHSSSHPREVKDNSDDDTYSNSYPELRH